MLKGFDHALNASLLGSALHVMSADLGVADRAHRKSSGVLAELLHLWEVVNVVDEDLGPGEGDGQAWLMGKKPGQGLWPPCEPLLVELPGIETGAEIALNCRNSVLDDAKVRETTRDGLRNTRMALMASTLTANLSQGATTVAPQGPVAEVNRSRSIAAIIAATASATAARPVVRIGSSRSGLF